MNFLIKIRIHLQSNTFGEVRNATHLLFSLPFIHLFYFIYRIFIPFIIYFYFHCFKYVLLAFN